MNWKNQRGGSENEHHFTASGITLSTPDQGSQQHAIQPTTSPSKARDGSVKYESISSSALILFPTFS